MESDAGFVEDVEDIDELRAYLCGKPYALALASREGDGGTAQREVVKADVEKELQASADFLEDFPCDALLLGVEMLLDVEHPVIKLADVHRGKLVYVLVMDAEAQCLAVEPRPATVGTDGRAGKLFGPFLLGGGCVAVLEHLYVLHQPFIGGEVVGRSMEQRTLYLDSLIRAVEYLVDGLFGQLVDRSLQRRFILLQQRVDLPEYHDVLILPQRDNGSFIDRQATVGDDFVDIYQVDDAQSLAAGTCPLGGVERKVVRSRFAIGQARDRTHQPLAVMAHRVRVSIEHHDEPVALCHGRGHTLGETLVVLPAHHQLVHDHLDVMVLIPVELHAVGHFAHFAIHPYIEVTLLAHLFEKLFVVSLSGANQGGEQHDAPSGIVLQYEVNDLFFCVFHHLLARQVGISRAGTSEKQTQIVIDFSRCPHSRTGVLVGGFLFDGDDGAQACNLVHIRTFHASKEVAGVSRKRLDVTSLSLSKERVKSQ